MIDITAIISTYNPNLNRLNRTLAALRHQTLPVSQWQLIIVDNNSTPAVDKQFDISWHPNSKIVLERRQGLAYARIKGFAAADAPLIIMVDDDNILDENYLQNVLTIFSGNPDIGAAGGKSLPLFESQPPAWLEQFHGSLALRNQGNQIKTAGWNNAYPSCAPIGAGMCLRQVALKSYIEKAQAGKKLTADRTAGNLSSGGDNEIVLEVLQSGWQVGYFPELRLQHIIPAERMQVHYLAKLVKQSNQSWVRLLEVYQINPWPLVSKLSVWPRKLKAYFTYRAWQGNANYINWKGACGTFDGLTK